MKTSASNAVSDERMVRSLQRPESSSAFESAPTYFSTLQAGVGNSSIASQESESIGGVNSFASQSTIGNAAIARAYEFSSPFPRLARPEEQEVEDSGDRVSSREAGTLPEDKSKQSLANKQLSGVGEMPATAGEPKAEQGNKIVAREKGKEASPKKKEGPEEKTAAAGGGGEAVGESEAAAAPSARETIAPVAAAVRQRAKGARAHSKSPDIPVRSAQMAGIDIETERKREAAASTVENIDKAGAKEVKRKAFREELRNAILKATSPEPTTESQADRVMKEGAKTASTTMRTQLTTERDEAATPMETAAKQEVNPSTIAKPESGDLVLEPLGKPPAPVSPASVVPEALPEERLDYSADRAPTDQAMAEAGVSTETLEKGNDPEFGPTLEARSQAEAHEAQVEGKYRASEVMVQKRTLAIASAGLTQGLGGMQETRELNIGNVVGKQTETERKEREERKRVTGVIDGIKNQTKKAVDDILNQMDKDAISIFEDGLRKAESAYENTFEEEKGGAWTWATTWGSSWKRLIERSLSKARTKYLDEVDVAIGQVADCIDGKLDEAKACVAQGLEKIKTFVSGLEGMSAVFGSEALDTVTEEFSALEKEIDGRRDKLVNKLADQYKQSYDRMSAMEEQLREANKSLWERVYDATVGLIKKIIAFKDMLFSVFAKAADVIGDIISDPIGFLGNLISAVMQGLENFMGRIEMHLQKGLLEWLLGALAGAGIRLPETFDLEGIVSIVLQILGLTYENFRARAVDLVGEPIVAKLEQGAEVFKVIISEGAAGIWRFIKDQLSELKSLVLDGIFNYIKDSVIMAGVTWIISLLNPASAFFKACKAIYEIVMFFIKKGSQIIDLVNAIIDSVGAIAKGALGEAAALVENALAKAIPVAIGFLASLLGIGDPSGPVREIIGKAREPVNKAIDWVINLAMKGVQAVGSAVGGLFGGKKKEKTAEEIGDEKTVAQDDPGKEAKVAAGLAAIDAEEQLYLRDGGIAKEDAEAVAAKVKKDHPVFQSIQVVEGKETWDYDYVASPGRKKTGERRSPADKILVIVKIIDRPKFKPSTKAAIPISKGEDRRHVDAWQVIHENLKLRINERKVSFAYNILDKLGHRPGRQTEAAVMEAAGCYLRKQFNDEDNLFAGPSKPNQEYGRKFAAARKRAELAFEARDKQEFEVSLEVLENLWRDPDAPDDKPGLKNLTMETVAMLRRRYRAQWG